MPAAKHEETQVQDTPRVTASLIAVLLAAPASAQDVAAGEDLYMKQCRACHGPTAKGLSSYPGLLGYPVDYLVDRLERYRAGERIGPNSMLMAPNVQRLSDEDIVNVSNFIASLE